MKEKNHHHQWLSTQEHLSLVAVDVTARSLRVRECVQGQYHREAHDFPGMQPVSLCKENVHALTTNYVVAVKTDGIRALLTLLPDDGGLYFTMRDMRTYRVRGVKKQQLFPMIAEDKPHLLYQLDGELLCQREKERGFHFLYVLHDVLSYRNQCMEPLAFRHRLACLQQLIPSGKSPVSLCSSPKKEESVWISVSLKSFLPLSELSPLRRSLLLPSDGFIFQSLDTPYRRGSSSVLFKWKPNSCNSVDLRVRVQRQHTPHHFVLYFMCSGEKQVHEINMHVPSHREQDCLSLHGKIVEFVRKGNQWQGIRFRTDKLEPNSYSTYQRVLQSIQDNIHWEQLLQHISTLVHS